MSNYWSNTQGIRCGTVCSILCLLLCASARANDTMVTLGAGGLVPEKSTQIVMESEELEISVQRITIHYVFRNMTERDIEALVAFPLPDLSGATLEFAPVKLPNESSVNFVNFIVKADGKPLPTEIESRAFLGSRDVTARLRTAGLSASVLPEALNSALMKTSPAQRGQLEHDGLLDSSEFNPPLRSTGKREGWCGRWTMRVRFYWTQRFPANTSVKIIETYQPVVGGSYIVAGDNPEWSVKPYCGGVDVLRKVSEAQSGHPHSPEGGIVLWEKRIKYILTTANNWSGPIGTFHLTIRSDSPEDIVLTCMPGLKQVGPTRYELSHSNFNPKSDLDLMILQRDK